jgi:glycosyltransferase involved in cell wall biosynthesis
MNWVFLDFLRIDYDVATPEQRALGGSQSALAYLALALARRGERVTTLTGTTKPREVHGVRCLQADDIPAEVFAPDDTIVVVNCGPADVIEQVRPAIPKRKIVLWTGHAHDQPAVQPLRDPACIQMWDRVACVSEWQKSMFHEHLCVPLEKLEVTRNAIAPAFERLFCDETDIIRAKLGALRLAYSSTPFRGLEILLACFPPIHKLHSSCRLDVFSSMQIYGRANEKDQYEPLYDRCRATDGVEYRGAVPQPVLAKELAATSILAYPNTFAETSCIAVMEALAAGMLVVTTDMGGLPETCSGFARLISPINKPKRTAEEFAMDYAKALDLAIRDWKSDHGGMMKKRFEQSEEINATCTWDIRAAEWLRLADRWLSASS